MIAASEWTGPVLPSLAPPPAGSACCPPCCRGYTAQVVRLPRLGPAGVRAERGAGPAGGGRGGGGGGRAARRRVRVMREATD